MTTALWRITTPVEAGAIHPIPHVRHSCPAQRTSGLGFGRIARFGCPVWGNRAAVPRNFVNLDWAGPPEFAAPASGSFVRTTDAQTTCGEGPFRAQSGISNSVQTVQVALRIAKIPRYFLGADVAEMWQLCVLLLAGATVLELWFKNNPCCAPTCHI
ncbi:MAG: hypothetical protein ABJ360_25960 [Roseobacter sp.]